jgi:TRAP-type C4-dicarboxylate transport system permease large subunit
VDESATGSVNSFSGKPAPACAAVGRPSGYPLAMHLRMPSIDHGVQSFLWALVFFLILYFGMVAIAVTKGTAFLLALVLSFLIFLFVRTRGT